MLFPHSHHHLPYPCIFLTPIDPALLHQGVTPHSVWGLSHTPSHEGRLIYNMRTQGSPQSHPRWGPKATTLLFELCIICKTAPFDLYLQYVPFYFLTICMFSLYHSNANFSRPREDWVSHLTFFNRASLIHSQSSQVAGPNFFCQQNACIVHLFVQNTASHPSRVWELKQQVNETIFLFSQSLYLAHYSSPLNHLLHCHTAVKDIAARWISAALCASWELKCAFVIVTPHLRGASQNCRSPNGCMNRCCTVMQ